jgi:hypothetical protein
MRYLASVIMKEKLTFDYSKLIEICGGETDNNEIETYEIVVTTSEGKSKAFLTNKNFQVLDVCTILEKFITKDKKII